MRKTYFYSRRSERERMRIVSSHIRHRGQNRIKQIVPTTLEITLSSVWEYLFVHTVIGDIQNTFNSCFPNNLNTHPTLDSNSLLIKTLFEIHYLTHSYDLHSYCIHICAIPTFTECLTISQHKLYPDSSHYEK